jgi:hypothetical protein
MPLVCTHTITSISNILKTFLDRPVWFWHSVAHLGLHCSFSTSAIRCLFEMLLIQATFRKQSQQLQSGDRRPNPDCEACLTVLLQLTRLPSLGSNLDTTLRQDKADTTKAHLQLLSIALQAAKRSPQEFTASLRRPVTDPSL